MNSYYSKVYIQKLFGGEGGIRTIVEDALVSMLSASE